MTPHRFKLGQSVDYIPDKMQGQAAAGSYKIIRLLPPTGQDQQYRIKNSSELNERIARESQLTLSSGS